MPSSDRQSLADRNARARAARQESIGHAAQEYRSAMEALRAAETSHTDDRVHGRLYRQHIDPSQFRCEGPNGCPEINP